jgi:hypothetical protein
VLRHADFNAIYPNPEDAARLESLADAARDEGTPEAARRFAEFRDFIVRNERVTILGPRPRVLVGEPVRLKGCTGCEDALVWVTVLSPPDSGRRGVALRHTLAFDSVAPSGNAAARRGR